MAKSSILRPVLLGGLIAGTIDIGAASLITGKPIASILHVVAGGLLGKAAMSGGAGVAVLGMVLQWAMSLLIAAIYIVGLRGFPTLRRSWLACGLGYGVVVFGVMNYVVLPFSAYRHAPHFTALDAGENLLAMLLFGLIIAFFAAEA